MESSGTNRYWTIYIPIAPRRAPVPQPMRNDPVLFYSMDIFHPGLHIRVKVLQYHPITIVNIQIPWDLHHGCSPVRGSHPAGPLTRHDHGRNACRFHDHAAVVKTLCEIKFLFFLPGRRAHIEHVFIEEALRPVVVDHGPYHGMGIPGPATFLPVGTIRRDTVDVPDDGPPG